jgi:hypothetical protein
MSLEGHDNYEDGIQTVDTSFTEEIFLTESCDPGCDVAMKTPLWKARKSLDGVFKFI